MARIVRGALWLGSGQMFGDLCAIVYLLILSRLLGASAFSDFVLVMAVGQSVAHLFGFQSWRTIVRFGHAAQAVPGGLAGLCRWVALRDLSVGLAGAGFAAAIVWTQGALLGIPPKLDHAAAWFSLTILLMQRGIPSGLLRLRQRFALCAAADAVLPVGRTLLALFLCMQGGGVVSALIGLAVAETIATATIWAIALSTAPDRDPPLALPLPSAAELNRFYWRTSVAEALRLAAPDVPVLGIALGGGGAALGAYRLAVAIAKATSKPALSVSIAFYSEAARQRARSGGVDPALVRHALGVSAAVAILSTLLCYVLTPLVIADVGSAVTTGLWLSMTVASLAAFLESRILVARAPLIAVAARFAAVASAFSVAWAFSRTGGSAAGLAAVASGGLLHFALLAAWLIVRRQRARASGPRTAWRFSQPERALDRPGNAREIRAA